MLELDKLTRRFGERVAVADVTLAIPGGQMVGVIGRSGAGKSTLLRMVNRLLDPSEGRVLFEGRDITGLRGSALHAWRASAAMIFQQFNLVPRLDVLTNVLAGRLNHIPTARALFMLFTARERALAIRALDRLDIADLALNRADALSGGQQQRVAIARALMQEPRLLLADEPIASLDPMNAKLVMDALRDINRRDGITVLCNLHTLDTARAYCDRIVGMAQGRIVFDGAPETLDEAAVRSIYGTADHERRWTRGSPRRAWPARRRQRSRAPDIQQGRQQHASQSLPGSHCRVCVRPGGRARRFRKTKGVPRRSVGRREHPGPAGALRQVPAAAAAEAGHSGEAVPRRRLCRGDAGHCRGAARNGRVRRIGLRRRLARLQVCRADRGAAGEGWFHLLLLGHGRARGFRASRRSRT